jgi:ADP-ribose pyrophosphatase
VPPLDPPPGDAALPSPPAIELSIAADRTEGSRATGGFMNLRRLLLTARYPDGRVSAPFPYDIATRAALDAVVILAHYELAGVPHVYLRSAIRPPCALRPLPPAHDGGLWELPAGLIEPDESPAEAAARELLEELGFSATARDMGSLGPWTFPAPGVIGERQLFFSVRVDPRSRQRPTEDGSALESGAAVVAVALESALAHCRSGAIVDSKTELALRRFAEGS